MRIAFVVGRFPVLSEAFILNQITGLIDRGHDVDIYSLEGPSDEVKVHPNVKAYHLLERVWYIPWIPQNYVRRALKGLKILILKFHENPTACLKLLNVFKYGRKAASLRLLYTAAPFLGQKPYDIIHCQFGVYARTALVMHQTGAIHGKLFSSFRGFDISKYIQAEGDRIYDELFDVGDFFLTNCDFFRQRAIQLGCNPQKIVVHRSGIDCKAFEFTPRYPNLDGSIRVATVGRLVEKKGIEYAIRAIAQVVKHYPKLEYSIVGDGALRDQLESLIDELELGQVVQLLGWRNQREIIEILDQSHIFIAPSVTASDGNQDAPVNTLKEALAMGLPVIATQHGGIPELVKNGISGFLVPERDAEAIADRLTHLIEHPELWVPLAKAGRACVEAEYDMEKLNDELVATYERVLNGTIHQEVSTIRIQDLNSVTSVQSSLDSASKC